MVGGDTRKKRQQKRVILWPAATGGNWSFITRGTGAHTLELALWGRRGNWSTSPPSLISSFGVDLMKDEFPGIFTLGSPGYVLSYKIQLLGCWTPKTVISNRNGQDSGRVGVSSQVTWPILSYGSKYFRRYHTSSIVLFSAPEQPLPFPPACSQPHLPKGWEQSFVITYQMHTSSPSWFGRPADWEVWMSHLQ